MMGWVPAAGGSRGVGWTVAGILAVLEARGI